MRQLEPEEEETYYNSPYGNGHKKGWIFSTVLAGVYIDIRPRLFLFFLVSAR